eukprot:CAMPEP_0194074124 /NCGR_PEP_ID=MMETSP0149-20130528/1325_1 /TAXON_ID=122233 /ORGANISM="Chaetoceros debilis, Strain MM31A-1" /LENGTH=201 /DNA_ID=CAMNT_0038754241 /DNA_START=30 /DNA_END=635 /DNA_ORIENTATION=-
MSSGVLGPIDDLFNHLLRTRLQRRAKSILVSGLEFLITDLAILFLAIDLNIQDKQVELGLFIVTGIGALYVLSLCVFLFVHASCYMNKDKMNTTAEIEEAFTKTNQIPFFDGIFELVFPAKFRGNVWYLPYIMWSFCVAIILSGAILYAFTVNEDVPKATTAALSASALLLYQITADFSEYWVISRNQERADEDLDEVVTA